MIITILIILFLLLLFMQMYDNKNRIYLRFKDRFKYVKNPGTLGVDMSYCIVMPDRMDHATRKMKELGGNYKLFNAIRPDLLSYVDYLTLSCTYLPGFQSFAKKSKLCVALSFFMCYYDAYLNGYNSICVFEDDVDFPHGTPIIRDAIQEFKDVPDLEVFYMGYCNVPCNFIFPRRVSTNLIDMTGIRIACNQGLCLKRSFLKKYMSGPLFYMFHNDVTLTHFCIRNGIGVVIPNKELVSQLKEQMGSHNGNHEIETTCDFTGTDFGVSFF